MWRDTKISDLEIAEGFATTLKTKHKIETAGDLATRWEENRLQFLLPKPGKSAVDLLVGELKRISNGESGVEEEAPASVKFEKPANGQASNGNGKFTETFQGETTAAIAVNETSAEVQQALETQLASGELVAVMSVPIAEWSRLQKLVGRVKEVEEKSSDVQRLKAEYAKKKDSSLAAKKTYDEATSELLDMIAGQLRINFDEEPEKAKPAKEEKAAPAADAWRATPLTVLPTVAADKKLAKRLATGGLKTVGNLQDVRTTGEWPKMKEDTKDKLQVEADVWLSKNRDAAVFAGANAEAAEREKEFPKQVEITKDILDQAHGNAVLVKAGTIMDTVKCKDGGVGVGVGGDVMVLDPDEWRPVVKTVKRPKTIILVKDVPGFANEEDRLKDGAEFTPVGWSGDCPLVKTDAGRETNIAPSEFQALGDETVEWPLEEVA